MKFLCLLLLAISATLHAQNQAAALMTQIDSEARALETTVKADPNYANAHANIVALKKQFRDGKRDGANHQTLEPISAALDAQIAALESQVRVDPKYKTAVADLQSKLAALKALYPDNDHPPALILNRLRFVTNLEPAQ